MTAARGIAILVAVLLVISGAIAAHASQYRLIGTGGISCGTWTALRQQGQAALPEQWILGFLSVVGATGVATEAKPLNGVDADGVWAWVDNFCAANPLLKISEAGEQFIIVHPR